MPDVDGDEHNHFLRLSCSATTADQEVPTYSTATSVIIEGGGKPQIKDTIKGRKVTNVKEKPARPLAQGGQPHLPGCIWGTIQRCFFSAASTRCCTKSAANVHQPEAQAPPRTPQPSVFVCVCVCCVRVCTRAFESADVHVHLSIAAHRDTTGNHRKQSFDAISVNMRNGKQDFFFLFQYIMSLLASTLSIGSLQTP